MGNAISTIQAFLALRRIAIVGASHDAKDFSREVMRAFLARGYDVVPINRRSGVIEGRVSYASLEVLPIPVEGVLLMVPPAEAAAVVASAVRAGVRHVWFHRGAGVGASSPEAVALAVAHGIAVVDGECPFMFLSNTHGVHAFHGALRRLGGAYPSGGVRAPPRGLVVLLMLLQAVLGVAAAVGGGLLVADPSGRLLGLDVAHLSGGPVADFLAPGILLLVVIGCGHLAAAVVTAAGGRATAVLAFLLGAFLVLWILAQWLWLTPTSPAQPICLALGIAEATLGLVFVRRARPPLAGPPHLAPT